MGIYLHKKVKEWANSFKSNANYVSLVHWLPYVFPAMHAATHASLKRVFLGMYTFEFLTTLWGNNIDYIPDEIVENNPENNTVYICCIWF